MKDFRKLREQALRQAHRQNDVISEGDIVMSARTGDKGTVHRTGVNYACLLYTSPSPRDNKASRMPSSA